MDTWLTNDVKEFISRATMLASARIGDRVENRRASGQEVPEETLTEYLMDALDSHSSFSVWGAVLPQLQERGIRLACHTRRSSREYETGADIGITISRNIHTAGWQVRNQHACLIQCKRIDYKGRVQDFFHVVKGSKRKQSSLLLDITPSSFYFIFVPPSLLETYCSIEPTAFMQAYPGCDVPVWNMGRLGFDGERLPLFSSHQKASTTAVLVIPALAVESHQQVSRELKLEHILSNCVPLWYWFSELFVPGFVGDRRDEALRVARNDPKQFAFSGPVPGGDEDVIGVRYTLDVSITSGLQ